MKVTLWPTKTPSSISTPSQINVWLEILQFFPTFAFFCISTNAPIFVLSPIWQPYRLMNLESLTLVPKRTSGATERCSPCASCVLPFGDFELVVAIFNSHPHARHTGPAWRKVLGNFDIFENVAFSRAVIPYPSRHLPNSLFEGHLVPSAKHSICE